MKSYEVLEELDGALGIFGKFDSVLLIGFGDGGFVKYSSEKAAKTFGIENDAAYAHHKSKFDDLQSGSVSLVPGDVFAARPLSVTKGGQVDLLILNLPLNIFRSLRSLQNFLPTLRLNGKVLISLELEGQPPEQVRHLAKKMIEEINLTVKEFAQPMVMPFAKNNLYAIAKNIPPDKVLEAVVLT